MESNKAPSSSASTSTAAAAAATSDTPTTTAKPAPSSSPVVATEARVEAVLAGMNRFAALSRAFVKPNVSASAAASPTSAASPSSSPSLAHKDSAGLPGAVASSSSSTTPPVVLASSSSSSNPAKATVPALAAGTSLMDRVQPAIASASPTPPATNATTKAADASAASLLNGQANAGKATQSTAAGTSGPEAASPNASASKLYRPPHAREDGSRRTPQPQSQQQQAASVSTSPSAPVSATANPTGASTASTATSSGASPPVGQATAPPHTSSPSSMAARSPAMAPGSAGATSSRGTPAAAPLTPPARKGGAANAWASSPSPSSSSTSPAKATVVSPSIAANTTMAARLREGASGGPLLPPSVHDEHADAANEHGDRSASPRSTSGPENTANAGGTAPASYVAAARRPLNAPTPSTSAAATAAEQAAATTTPLSGAAAPAATTATAPAVSSSSAGQSVADFSSVAAATSPSIPAGQLIAEEVCPPTKLSRSAMRKRKLRAVKAAAAAAALAEAQASGKPVSADTNTPKKKKMSGAANTGKPADAAATSGTEANTCGVSRRPGWHPSLAVASAMVTGESLAEMAAGYTNFVSGPANTSSSSSSHPSMRYPGQHAHPTTTTSTAAAASSGENSACGSARHEPANATALFIQQQQQQQQQQQLHHHHYHGYNPYANSAQRHMSYFEPTLTPTSPGQPQLLAPVESASSGGGMVGSGAAGTMFDTSMLPSAGTLTGMHASSTAAAGPTRGTVLHRGRGAAAHAAHAPSNAVSDGTNMAAAGLSSQALPTRLPSSGGAMVLQSGHLPSIRVGTAGTLVNPPIPGVKSRSSLTLNTSSRQDSSAAAAATMNSPTSTMNGDGGGGNSSGAGVPRHHHHHHQHHSSASLSISDLSARHLRTSSSFSGNSSPTMAAAATATITATAGQTRMDPNAEENTAVYTTGDYTTQEQQQMQQHPGEWSASPLTPSSLRSATVGWSGLPHAKTSVSSSTGGSKMKGGSGINNTVNSTNSHPQRTSSRGRSGNAGNGAYQNNSSNGHQMYAANNPAAAGAGGMMGTYNNSNNNNSKANTFRNVGGGNSLGGRYGGQHAMQQQQQHNAYMNPALYADPAEGGMMNMHNQGVVGHAGHNQQPVAMMNNNSNNNGNSAVGGAPSPMPYYDFFTVLPTFVAACLTLQPEDEAAREQLCWTIEAVLRRHLKESAEIRVHGSVTTGLALPSSDVDVLVVDYQPIPPLVALHTLSNALINLDDTSLKDALEFQDSVEREKHQQKLAEQRKQQQSEDATVLAEASSAEEKSTSGEKECNMADADARCSADTDAVLSTFRKDDTTATGGRSGEAAGKGSGLAAHALPGTAEHTTELSSAAAAAKTTTTTTSSPPASLPVTLDGRKAFLTATTTLFEDADGADLAAARDADDKQQGRGTDAAASTEAAAAVVVVTAAAGQRYASIDAIAAEETEVYGTVDDVEQAEEVFRDQIEKDYSFSTTLDVSSLFAPVMASGNNNNGSGGGVAPKVPASSSPLSGPAVVASTTTAWGGRTTSSSASSTSFGSSSSPSTSSASTDDADTTSSSSSAEALESRSSSSDSGLQTQRVAEQPKSGAAMQTEQPTLERDDEQKAAASEAIVREKKEEEELRQTATAAATTTTTDATNNALLEKAVAAAPAQRLNPVLRKVTQPLPSAMAGRPGTHLTFVPVHDGQFYLVQAITATRVPVIKLTDKATGTKVDITFAGGEHWRSMQLTKALLDVFPQARPLILFLKFCVRSLGVGESEPGGVTSFTIYLMVLHFYNECRKRVISILQEREGVSPTSHDDGATAAAAAAAAAALHRRTTSAALPAESAMAASEKPHSTPLPSLSAQEEQQPRARTEDGGGGPSPGGASSFSEVSPLSASPTTTTAAAAAAPGPTASVDLGILEFFLSNYLARVEERHAQLIAAKAAATTATEEEEVDDDDGVRRCVAAEEPATGDGATSPPSDEKNEAAAAGDVHLGGRSSSSVGACATIRAAYTSADKAHLQTIREVILGFVGQPGADAVSVPGATGADHHNNEGEEGKSNAGLVIAGGDGHGVLGSGQASPQPQGATVGESGDSEGACIDGGGDGRSRHAPPLHHYLLKTVEPQAHERASPVAAAVSKERGEHVGEGKTAEDGNGGSSAVENQSKEAHDSTTAPHPEARETNAAGWAKKKPADDSAQTSSDPPSTAEKRDNKGSQAENGSKEKVATDAAAASSPCLSSVLPDPSGASPAYEQFAEDFLQRQVNVSDLFLDFCHYYGCAFDYETCGIRFSMDGSSEVVEKPYLCSRRGQHFHLTSPFDPEYDLTARMTHMRDFQWLCWWFTEWGAARQAPMYYGGCSLQYVLQCLTPHTAESDCQAVHQRLMDDALAAARNAARRSGAGAGAGAMNVYPSPMNFVAQQQQQQQHQGVNMNGDMVNMGLPQQQQQQQQHDVPHTMMMMRMSSDAGDEAFGMSHPMNGSDPNGDGVQQQQHPQQQMQQCGGVANYGSPMTDPLYPPQQQHQQSYAMSPTETLRGQGGGVREPPATSFSPGPATGNLNASPAERSDCSQQTAESLYTEANGNFHPRPPLQSMQQQQQQHQLPFVDSRELLEGFGTYGTLSGASATNGDGEEEAEDVRTFHSTNDGTTSISTHDGENASRSPLENSEDEPEGPFAASEPQRYPQHDRTYNNDGDNGQEGADRGWRTDADEPPASAQPTTSYHDGGTQGNADAQVYAGGYPAQTTQRNYRRPYGNQMGYYDMQHQQQHRQQQQQQQSQQVAAAAYFQAYANMNNVYAHNHQHPPQQQQHQYQTNNGPANAAANFYAPAQPMVYPSQHLLYQQQQQLQQQQQQHAAAAVAAAAASNASNYPFPILHYDVQQYLWMQEQQKQKQQQQQQLSAEKAQRVVSREPEMDVNVTSEVAASSPGAPSDVPVGRTPNMQQQHQQQQQYYAAYGMYPNMYNDNTWNHAGAAAVVAGGAQQSMAVTSGSFQTASTNMMPHMERGAGDPYPHQPSRGGHPRNVHRRQGSLHETRNQPQHARQTAKHQHQQQQQHPTPTTSAHRDAALSASNPISEKREKTTHSADVESEDDAQQQQRQRLARPKHMPALEDKQQRSQHGTPVMVSPSLSPTVAPRPRSQSLPLQ